MTTALGLLLVIGGAFGLRRGAKGYARRRRSEARYWKEIP